jgi:amidohydrolase
MEPSEAKRIAREQADRAHEALVGLSHWIHANPELGYAEHMAAGWVAEWLEKAGFETTRGVGGLETAVLGTYGPGPLNVAYLIEYDALPEVGHACGHNVIAAASVGAAVALAPVAEQLGLRVTAIGTPAEEGGAGKQLLMDAGVFEGVHAALMIHPGPNDQLLPEVLAAQSLDIAYDGVPSHAGAFPERGVNAADAMVVAQVALGLLRQSLLPTDRVHGIVTVGGEAMNIIPARTEARWMIRAATVARMDEVREKVLRCFEAGALASGAALSVNQHVVYADMIHDADLTRLYRANVEALGRTFIDTGGPIPADALLMTRFSTDMGNVSYAMPSIHPIIGIDSAPAVNHQPEFTAAAATPAADKAILDGAIALAWTAIDAANDDEVRNRLLGA